MPKEKIDISALIDLKDHRGWKIVESWVKEAIEVTKDNLARGKIATDMTEVARLQGKYQAYTTLLFLIDRKIEKGKEKDNNAV